MNAHERFVDRLRERKLVQWGLAYLAGAWLLLQVLDFMRENFGWSARVVQIVTVVAVAGFVATLVLAWYHGDKGRQRVGRVEFVILLGVLVLGGFAVSLVPRGAGPDDEPADGDDPDYVVRGADPSVTMAVLPFENLSVSQEDVGLAEGLTLEIASQLSKVADLRIIARSAVLAALESGADVTGVGVALGASRVLEGTVQATPTQVRITAHLNDVATREQVWSETYTQELTDIFALQSEVALAIVEALEAELTPDERTRIEDPSTEDLAAFRIFQRQATLRGSRPEQNRLGIELLKEAVELDPEYATAWARLGWRYAWEARMGGAAALDTARLYADRALEIDPESSPAHYTLATVRTGEGRRSSVLAYRRALELDPSNPSVLNDLSAHLTETGNLEEALDLGLRGVGVSPNSAIVRWHAGVPLLALGDDERTRAWLERAVALFPEQDMPRLDQMRAELDLIAGNVDAAREQALSLLRTYAERPEPEHVAAWLLAAAGDWPVVLEVLAAHAEQAPGALSFFFGLTLTTRTLYAAALVERGERTRADALLDESLALAQEHIDSGSDLHWWHMELAAVHSLSGRTDAALDALERAYGAGYRYYRQLRVGPAFQTLRDDGRFERLLERMERDVARMRANAERDGLFAKVDSVLDLP